MGSLQPAPVPASRLLGTPSQDTPSLSTILLLKITFTISSPHQDSISSSMSIPRMSAMLSARKTTDTESDSFQSITNNVTCFLDTAATTADPAKMEDKHGLSIKGIANFLGSVHGNGGFLSGVLASIGNFGDNTK